jgi:hypothetical protein
VSDDELIELKNRAAALLLQIPGVTAVGLGGRERAGKPTGEIVLKVFVARKRPASELAPGELLPERFEGLGVDVTEMGESVLLAGPGADPLPPQPGSPQTSEGDIDKTDERPALRGGFRIQASLSGAGFGTLGCFLIDPAHPDQGYALTNWHVVAPDNGNDLPVKHTTRMGQSDNSSGPSKCCNHIIGTYVAGGLDDIWDAAAIQLDPGVQWLAEITCIGIVTGSETVTVGAVAPLTYQVRKRGIRTGLTGGTVLSTHTAKPDHLEHPGIVVPTHRSNDMVIKPNKNAGVGQDEKLFFADRGDSGSAVVNENNKVVALLYSVAGGGPTIFAHATPIADVLKQFTKIDNVNWEVATATDGGQVHTVPGTPPAFAGPRAREPVRALVTAGTTDALDRVRADLGASPGGRALRALWLDHGAELLDLINTRRRVTLAWHRDGGPALAHSFFRAATVPGARIPAVTAGEPPMNRLARIHAVLRANASPDLRQALDEALTALPDPAGRTYDQFLAALAGGS